MNTRFRLRQPRTYQHAEPLEPLGQGPLEPEIIPATDVPRDLYEDDHLSELRDDWRAEAREWAREEYDR